MKHPTHEDVLDAVSGLRVVAFWLEQIAFELHTLMHVTASAHDVEVMGDCDGEEEEDGGEDPKDGPN